jgi:hypothetical protein
MALLYDARGNEWLGAIDQITNGTLTDARTITSTLGALNAEVVMDCNGHSAATFDVRTAAANLTLAFEGTVDGVNYIALPAFNLLTEALSTAVVLTTTSATVYLVQIAGLRRIRIRVQAYTSGTVTIASRATVGQYNIRVRPQPSLLHVTATAAVNTAVTATLPAAGAGLYHYITKVQLVKLYAVVGVAAGAGVIVTTTNLPGSPAWTTEQNASPAGAAPIVVDWDPSAPLKSSVANTNTTFVAPLQLQTIWRWNVSYYVGA